MCMSENFNTEISISFQVKQPDKSDLLLGTIILLGSNGQEMKTLLLCK